MYVKGERIGGRAGEWLGPSPDCGGSSSLPIPPGGDSVAFKQGLSRVSALGKLTVRGASWGYKDYDCG
jgi:hypothetical protein